MVILWVKFQARSSPSRNTVFDPMWHWNSSWPRFQSQVRNPSWASTWWCCMTRCMALLPHIGPPPAQPVKTKQICQFPVTQYMILSCSIVRKLVGPVADMNWRIIYPIFPSGPSSKDYQNNQSIIILTHRITHAECCYYYYFYPFVGEEPSVTRSRPKLNCGPGRDFEVGPEFGAARKQPIIPGNSRARSCAGEEDRVTWLDLRPG